MDALRLRISLSFLLLLSLFSSSAVAVADTTDKVSFEIYYESLCPYCSNLIVNYLYKLFDTDLISITDFKLIPYGNAKISPNGTIFCQHGQYECLLNTVEACAIHAWPNLKDHFPFVYCVESLVYHHNYTYWETCFQKLNLDASPVTACLKNGLGKELELGYAAETSALKPPHKYVPWVVVDGQPLYDDYRDFVSYICKAYKGTKIPAACTESSIEGVRKLKTKLVSYLYGEEELKPKLSRIGQTIRSWVLSLRRFG